ncbi:MAG: glycosyltransferase family 2 protein [Candidatus Sumerlaeota bacterium]|nr:glycosyltransferase family 2 protein [Candidatus Sumerlaeota bacterium]
MMSQRERHNVWIVVAAFNEAQAIAGVLRSLIPLGHSIVVVDDGSSDDTTAAVRQLPVHSLRHPINLGQGAALQTGIDYALHRGAEFLVTFDADGQHRAEDVPPLLQPVLAGECDVALGTRFRHPESRTAIPPVRRIVLRLATRFTRLTSGIRVTDTHNGLRALNRRAAERIRITLNRMAHASEILEQISRQRLRIQEVDVRIVYDRYSTRKGQRSLNALNILVDLLQRRLRR